MLAACQSELIFVEAGMRRERIPGIVRDIMANPGDWRKIAEFIRGIGHELPRKRLAVLAELRSCIANAGLGEANFEPSTLRSAFLDGAMFAVREALAAYEAEVEAEYRPKMAHYDGLGCFTCGDVAYTNGLTFKDLMREGMLEFVEGRPVFVKHFKCCAKYIEPPEKTKE